VGLHMLRWAGSSRLDLIDSPAVTTTVPYQNRGIGMPLDGSLCFSCESPFMTPVHHPVSAIVYSALGHETSSVMIDGRFVMRDGAVTSVDEPIVRLEAQRRANELARRSGIDRFRKRAWRSI
jgi:hypothetical protein